MLREFLINEKKICGARNQKVLNIIKCLVWIAGTF